MNALEWHDLTALFVSLVALVVSGIAAANQLASLKSPTPEIELELSKQISTVSYPATHDYPQRVVVAIMVVRVTNTGHETMFHPAVYDWTPNYPYIEGPSEYKELPRAIGPGQQAEVAINYSHTNSHNRVIGVVWEESSLFKREPKVMGVRVHVLPNPIAMYQGFVRAKPVERWKTVGPFHKKGWQRLGFAWPFWRPVLSPPKKPSDGSTWQSTTARTSSDSQNKYQFVWDESSVLSRNELTREQFAQYHEAGKAVPDSFDTRVTLVSSREIPFPPEGLGQ